jgi:hypothetical protein
VSRYGYRLSARQHRPNAKNAFWGAQMAGGYVGLSAAHCVPLALTEKPDGGRERPSGRRTPTPAFELSRRRRLTVAVGSNEGLGVNFALALPGPRRSHEASVFELQGTFARLEECRA